MKTIKSIITLIGFGSCCVGIVLNFVNHKNAHMFLAFGFASMFAATHI